MDPVARMATLAASKIRNSHCRHGIPDAVLSKDPIPPWGQPVFFKPVCEACCAEAVMESIREVFDDMLLALDKSLRNIQSEAIGETSGENNALVSEAISQAIARAQGNEFPLLRKSP